MNTTINKHTETIENKTSLDTNETCVQLINEIDFLISKSSTVPLTNKVMVNADELFALTEKFRAAFPKEITEAAVVIQTVQEMVSKAELQANNIINSAHIQANSILNESRLIKEAQIQAEQIVAVATSEKELLKQEASTYLKDSFSTAENELLQLATALKQARESI